MAFEKPGGYVWGGETQERRVTASGQAMRLAAAMAGAGVIGYGSTRTMANGYRPIDLPYHASRVIGDLSPASFLNTFRATEWMSPFASNKALGIDGGVFEWDLTGMNDTARTSTFKAIQSSTGLTKDQLRLAGIEEHNLGGVGQAHKLKFSRGNNAIQGTLHSITDRGEHLLNANMALQEANPNIMSTRHGKISKAAYATFQALGLTEDPKFSANDVFVRDLGLDAAGEMQRSTPTRFIPVPGLARPTSITDAYRISALARAPSAFGMERPNALLEGFAEQVPLLGKFGEKFTKTIGHNLKVTSGPASSMFFRYGGRAAGLGAMYLGYQQLDWLHRQGPTGHMAAATAGSVGAGYLVHRVTKSARAAFAVTAGSMVVQTLMPGFHEGITSGVISTYQTANVVRAAASPFSTQRRMLEGMMPGVSSLQTGVLLAGIPVLAASYFALPMVGRVPEKLIQRFGHEWLGLQSTVQVGGTQSIPFVPVSTRETFWSEVEQHASTLKGYSHTSQQTFNKLGLGKTRMAYQLAVESSEYGGTGFAGKVELAAKLRNLWTQAEETTNQNAKHNPMNASLEAKLRKIDAHYRGDDRVISKVGRAAEGLLEQVRHSFFGADPLEAEFVKRVSKIGFSPKIGRAALLFGAAVLFQQVATGGLLGSMETAKDLRAQYEGRQLVKVNRGRGWEGGSNPYEGETSGGYFRPHWSYLAKNHIREKGIWGDEEESVSPIGRFFLSNFTYHLEEKNYYDRPYPISGAAFENVPVIGKILGATIGRLIKPATIMHADEWMRAGQGGGLEYADTYQGWKREPAYALGAQPSGVPYHTLGAEKLFGQTIATFREMEGFTGWGKNLLMDKITGQDTFFSKEPVLASSSEITSPSRAFWDLNMGGALFSNELVRRFLDKDYSKGEKINPIVNSMPSWMPVKFRHGDPYTGIEWGEARLPGAGFVGLHPELKGVDAQDYPLIYQYGILADVAPFSPELEMTRRTLYAQRSQGKTGENENAYIDYIDQLLQKKTQGVDSERIHKNAIEIPMLSRVTQTAWSGMQSMVREVAAPVEYLIPMGFRPTHKLMGDRSPIEEYEYQRLYGSKTAFWDKPWRDWFRPAAYSAMHVLGYEGKPQWRQDADETNAQFDQVDFAKWMSLSEKAAQEGNVAMSTRYRYMANTTRAGVNPQGTPMGIYWSLPAEDRPFFNAFLGAQGGERERIMEMIPKDQVGLYQSMWSRIDKGDPEMWAGSKTRMSDQYLTEKFSQLRSDETFMQSLPQEDWIGWHCLPPEQLVWMGRLDLVAAGMIESGTVWQTGNTNMVLAVHSRHAEAEEMLTIQVARDRCHDMKATSDHKVLAWKSPWGKDHLRRVINRNINHERFQSEWIRVKDLTVGDYLAIPIPAIAIRPIYDLDLYSLSNNSRKKADQDHVWTYYLDKNLASKCPRTLALNTDIAWLVGYYLAEGNVYLRSGHARGVEFTSNLDEEQDLRNRCLAILDSAGIEGAHEYHRYRKTGNCGTIKIENHIFAEVIQYFAPGQASTKHLEHSELLLTSPDHILQFLAGYLAGDGGKEASGCVACSVSHRLVQQIAELMISVGVIPSISTVMKKDRKQQWIVRFARLPGVSESLHDLVIRDLFIGKTISAAKPKAFIVNGCLYSKISAIESTSYTGPVYDFTIESDPSYRSLIGLYHNSDVDLGDIKAMYVDKIGGDLHDYGMWERQLEGTSSQPYLEGSEAPMAESVSVVRNRMTSNLTRMMRGAFQGPSIITNSYLGSQAGVRAQLTVNDDRFMETQSQLRGWNGE